MASIQRLLLTTLTLVFKAPAKEHFIIYSNSPSFKISSLKGTASHCKLEYLWSSSSLYQALTRAHQLLENVLSEHICAKVKRARRHVCTPNYRVSHHVPDISGVHCLRIHFYCSIQLITHICTALLSTQCKRLLTKVLCHGDAHNYKDTNLFYYIFIYLFCYFLNTCFKNK